MEFPLFEEAEFVEALLGAGECLYIPVIALLRSDG